MDQEGSEKIPIELNREGGIYLYKIISDEKILHAAKSVTVNNK
jgi:hypothetical protein